MARVNNSAGQAQMRVTDAGPGHLSAKISGELDIVSVSYLDDQIAAFLERTADRVDLDLSELEFMDSSGIALLLRISNRFGPLQVRGAKPLVRRVIEVTGLTTVLRIDEDLP
jgi:anti-sigma B factor antagonist